MQRYCVLVFLFLCLAIFISVQDLYSQELGKPIGCLKQEIPAGSQRLSSLPFIPFDSSINTVFAGMLTGGISSESADRIVKWNPQTQTYTTFFKLEGSGDALKDGKWLDSITQTVASEPILPGEGIWIQNQHEVSQTVLLAGQVPLADNVSVKIYPGLNIFSYPYPSSLLLNASRLKFNGALGASEPAGNPDSISSVLPDASFWLKSLNGDINDGKWMNADSSVSAEFLKAGKAYWYNRKSSTEFDWIESRPYTAVFSDAATVPQITSITFSQTKDSASIRLAGTGISGEKFILLYKDLQEADSIDFSSKWKIAVRELSSSGGHGEWTDLNISNTYIRIYAAGRQDVDSDNDGLSDVEEKYVYGTDHNKVDTDGDGMPDGWEIRYGLNPLVNDASSDLDGDGLSNLQEYINGGDPVASVLPVPRNLKAVCLGFNKIVLTWDAVPEIYQPLTYQIYRDELEVGNTSETFFSDTPLQLSSSYSYKLKFSKGSSSSDFSDSIILKTNTLLGTPDDQTIIPAVNAVEMKGLNAGNIVARVQDAFRNMGYTDTNFYLLNPSLVNKFVENEYAVITQPDTPMTSQEKAACKQEIDNIMNNSFKGHSFSQVYLYFKLLELADMHWQAGNIEAADLMYDYALRVVSDVDEMTFLNLWQRSRFKMASINDQSSDDALISAMDASRDMMLKYFDYFPEASSIQAIQSRITIAHRYFNSFPRFLSYNNYSQYVYNQALSQAKTVQALDNNSKYALDRVKRIESWELQNSFWYFRTPEGTPLSGHLIISNSSPDNLYPLSKISDERYFYINDGVVTVPLYKGHSYKAVFLADVEGGAAFEHIINVLPHEKGKRYRYQFLDKTSADIETVSGDYCEYILTGGRPIAPYNLKASRLPETFTLSWTWVPPSSVFSFKEFAIFRSGTEIGRTSGYSLPGIVINSSSMSYSYTVAAVNSDGQVNTESIPLEVLPQMTAETSKYYAWKNKYFGSQPYYDYQDNDGDGLSNYQEYLLGSNPLAAPASNSKASHPDAVDGFHVDYYSGTSAKNKLSLYFTNCSPFASAQIENLNFVPTGQNVFTSGLSNYVAFSASAYIEVPAEDTYRFYLSSSDGSRLYIDGVLTIDNDGVHTRVEKCSDLKLKAGTHSIKVEFFEYEDFAELGLEWSSSAFARKPIGSDVTWYTANPLPELTEQICQFKDTDADGLCDREEILAGTSLSKADSDGDGFNDYDELNRYGTDPVNASSMPSSGIPATWTGSTDINTSIAGRTVYTAGLYELFSAGSDIASSQDSCRFLYENISGNCEITAKVTYIDPYSSTAKAGVMIRESLLKNSKSFASLITPLSQGSYSVFRRLDSAVAVSTQRSADRMPLWVRVKRIGNQCSSFISTDGNTWTKTAEEYVSMNSTISAGLVFSSNSTAKLREACFESVSVRRISATPVFSPSSTYLKASDTPSISIASATQNVQIRYTLDGSEPTAASTLYSSPLDIQSNGTVCIKAKAFQDGYEASETVTKLYSYTHIPGLLAKHYNGYFYPFSRFDSASPVKLLMVPQINYASTSAALAGSLLTDNFGVSFTGSLYVPASGEYTFYLSADDYGRLLIDGAELISNAKWDAEKSAKLTLSSGLHSIRVDMTEGTGTARTVLQWDGPGISKQVIPAAFFFSADTDSDAQPDSWEIARYGNLSSSDGTGDLDNDGFSDANEFTVYQTNPEDASSQPLNALILNTTPQEGLIASYFKLTRREAPKFEDMTYYKTEKVSSLYVPVGSAKFSGSRESSYIGAVFKGYIDIPENALFNFYLKADDGAKLWIDGTSVNSSFSADITTKQMMAKGLHQITVEYYQLLDNSGLSLEWEYSSHVREIIPATKFFHTEALYASQTAENDSDGDGLSDMTEIRLGTNPNIADSDGDGLSDGEEINVYHTDPLKTDSDMDGVNDYEEVKSAFTDPSTADFVPESIQNIIILNGSEVSAVQGEWNLLNNSAQAKSRRGWLEYKMNIVEPDIYRISILAKDSMLAGFEVDLSIYVDGQFCERRKFISKTEEFEEVNIFMPYLVAGEHTVRIFWDGYRSSSSLSVKSISLQKLSSAANRDWKAIRLNATCKLNAPSVTKVSPLYIEGVDLYPSMMKINDGEIAFSRYSTKNWYADVTLPESGTKRVNVSFQNGGRLESKEISWAVTNLLSNSNSVVTLRKGDSLLIGAWPDLVPVSGSFTFSYNGSVFSSNAGIALPLRFDTAGTYVISGEYTYPDGNKQNASITVKVFDYNLSSIPVQDAVPTYTVKMDLPKIPEGLELTYDPMFTYFNLDSSSPSDKSRFNILIDENEIRPFAVRIPSGSVLASSEVKGLRVFSAKQTYVKHVKTFDNGTLMYEMMVIQSPVLADITVQLRIFVAGVLFDDGSTSKNLTASDFNELGEAKVYFLYPPGTKTSVCHELRILQNGKFIGGR